MEQKTKIKFAISSKIWPNVDQNPNQEWSKRWIFYPTEQPS